MVAPKAWVLAGRLALLASLGIAVATGVAATLATPSRARGSPPNVLLVTLDTTRADHTSAYGYDRPTTPRLARLAREGVAFDAAYAPVPATTPSHATMFTALEPRMHGVLRNGEALAPSHVTLAEILTREGYRTGAIVSAYPLHRSFGLLRGFASYDDDFADRDGGRRLPKPWLRTLFEGQTVAGDFDRRGDATARLAIEWLDGLPRGTRFFLWVHLFDAHSPYAPPAEDAALFPPRDEGDLARQIGGYDGELHFADRQMGAVLDRLAAGGLLDDTLIVVVGDHGEGLMQHGWMNHGLFVYEEDVRVPLVLRWPRALPAGRRVQVPVRLADLAPTILDLVGSGERLPSLDGESFADRLRVDLETEIERPIFLQRRPYDGREVDGWPVIGEKAAVRLGRWKYIAAPDQGSFELYDLAADPGERRNVHDQNSEIAKSLAGILSAWQAARPAPAALRPSSPDRDEKLRALGYVD